VSRSVQEAKQRQPWSFGRIGLLFRIGVLLVPINACGAVAAFASCAAPRNPIEAENCLPGNPSSQWYVVGAGSTNIQGFTTDISVNAHAGIEYFCSTIRSCVTIRSRNRPSPGLGRRVWAFLLGEG